MVWTTVVEFPQGSVAIHVRVMTWAIGQTPAETTSLKDVLTGPPQLSDAVRVPVGLPTPGATFVPQSIWIGFATVTDATGGVRSWTVIVWVQIAVRGGRQSSVTV